MGRAGTAVPALLLLLTGCTGAVSAGDRTTAVGTQAGTASAGEASASAAPTASGGWDPRTPPQLPDAQRTFVEAGGETGAHSFPVISDIRRGTLQVSVVCSGSVTVEVKVGSMTGSSTVCADGGPGQYDEMVVDREYRNVSVSVTSRTTGSWGLSVGWTKVVAEPPG